MTSLRSYPHSLVDQNFGLCITPEDLIFPFSYHSGSNYCRPWRWFKRTGNRDSGSSIDEANNILKITLDVQHFKPDEIKVKVTDSEIIVEAHHEEKLDEHGFISRQFKRRYVLPFEYSSDTVDCTLSSDGILILTAKKITKTTQTREIIVPIQICEASKKLDTNSYTKKHESDTKNLKSSTQEAAAKAHNVSNQIMTNENYNTKINESDVKTLESAAKEISAISFSKDNYQTKEDHCRLLKPELLGAAVSEIKKADELKQITEQVSATSKTIEFAAHSEVCIETTSTKAEETLLIDKSTEALSDNKYAGLGINSTISDHCQTTSDIKDINRISELSSALEEASANSLSTTENILQLAENMNVNVRGTSSHSQEIMESLETSSLRSNASALSSQEMMEAAESKLKESMKLSESLGARSLGVGSKIEDMMDKCSAEIAEVTNKYSAPGLMGATGTAKMQSTSSYSSSEIQESSYSSSTTSSERASIMSDIMSEKIRK